MKGVPVFLLFFIYLSLIGLASAGTVEWSGINWNSRDNPYTDPSCSWIDNSGNLHLKLEKINGVYKGALFESVDSFEYGTFTWTVKSPSLNLERGSTLGFFTYNDDGIYPLNEIDIEINQWPGYNERVWFVLQPGALSSIHEDKVDYSVARDIDDGDLKYTIEWTPEKVHWSIATSSGEIISEWSYDDEEAIQDDPARACFDLLVLNGGKGPESGDTIEVVLSDFEYIPYGEEPEKKPLESAGDVITISSSGSDSEQDTINEAIDKMSESGGGTVYLTAGVYLVDGPVIIKSNVHLTGDPNAIIRVSSTSSQWFKGQIGVICNPTESVQNVEISGFQIDGNIKNLPREYDSTPGHKRDCEKLILFGGWSSKFAHNVKIHDMKLYNAFSDGIYLRFVDGAACYNNIISNCQHEGIYLSCVTNGLIYGNKIAGITSDCARLDNCQNCKVYDNLFFSYDGDSHGAYKHGENGLQIGGAGVSKGYDGRNKPLSTKNIEVFNNTFADPGLKAIWLHPGTENVYIHDNRFIDASELETSGFSIGDISYDNQPSIEMSEQIFDNLFDVYKMQFSDSAYIPQGIMNPDKELMYEGRYSAAWIDVPGYEGQLRIGNKTYIPKSPDQSAIVLFGTENLAERPVSKKATKNVFMSDGNLTVSLDVKTKYEVRAYHTYKVLGQSIRVPYYKEKTESVTFTKSFNAPDIFPAFQPPRVKVTHYNGSHAVVSTPKIDGIVRVDTSYNHSECTERRLIGYIGTAQNGFKSTHYEHIDSWGFLGSQMSRNKNGVRINEPFDIDNLNVTVTTPYDSFVIDEFDYVVIEDDSRKILNFTLFSVLGCVWIYGRAIKKVLYMAVMRWI